MGTSNSSEKVIRAEEGGGATLSDEQVVQQIYPDALEWFDDDGTWFISLPHIGEAESAADAWADARARLAAIPEPVVAPIDELKLECFGLLRSLDHFYGEEFTHECSTAQICITNIRRIINMPPVVAPKPTPEVTTEAMLANLSQRITFLSQEFNKVVAQLIEGGYIREYRP